jgi:hypothetical protein
LTPKNYFLIPEPFFPRASVILEDIAYHFQGCAERKADRMKYCCVAIALWAMGGLRSDHAGEVPTTRPASVPPSHAMPEQFNVLTTRSIFARNGIAIVRSKTMPVAGPGLALRGVVLDDGGYVAIFEDAITHQTQNVREGASFGGGSIRNLTLHGFDYVAAERRVTVAIGQNLQGEFVAPPAVPKPTVVAEAPAAAAKDTAAPETPPAPDAISAAAIVEGMPMKMTNVVVVPAGPPGNGGAGKRKSRPTKN